MKDSLVTWASERMHWMSVERGSTAVMRSKGSGLEVHALGWVIDQVRGSTGLKTRSLLSCSSALASTVLSKCFITANSSWMAGMELRWRRGYTPSWGNYPGSPHGLFYISWVRLNDLATPGFPGWERLSHSLGSHLSSCSILFMCMKGRMDT